MSCLVLSCLVLRLSCLVIVWSCLVMIVLPCQVLSCLVLSVLSCLILSCLCFVLSWSLVLVLSSPLLCLVWSLALSRAAFTYLAGRAYVFRTPLGLGLGLGLGLRLGLGLGLAYNIPRTKETRKGLGLAFPYHRNSHLYTTKRPAATPAFCRAESLGAYINTKSAIPASTYFCCTFRWPETGKAGKTRKDQRTDQRTDQDTDIENKHTPRADVG